MATFGVGDEYYAVNVVLFEGKELPIELLNQLKDNLRIRLKGTLELDYSGEKQIMGQGLEILPDEEMRADPYPEGSHWHHQPEPLPPGGIKFAGGGQAGAGLG